MWWSAMGSIPTQPTSVLVRVFSPAGTRNCYEKERSSMVYIQIRAGPVHAPSHEHQHHTNLDVAEESAAGWSDTSNG